MEPAVDRLDLVEIERSRPGSPSLQTRARFIPRLEEPLTQLDFVIDGASVLQQVLSVDLPLPYGLNGSQFVSVADLAWPEPSALSLRQLLGAVERDSDWDVLEPGRLPLYGCPECGDVYCGALTIAVEREVDPGGGQEVVRWTDVRYEDAQTPAEEMPDLSPVGSFTFDATHYDSTLHSALRRMEDLAADEHQAEAAWKARRGPRARLRRLLTPRTR
ncbi:hypothetical protein GTR02_03690 [Kineococcus sp. R8]|uniref:hypothetical protein n=1 Tax=Kineococcus siccus TaxID=2696567 RepID=UPI001412FB29|nr:hypothetical protein [Kineococcus siccus]NAZ80916.1 hypothetical protein [Kineococcus siccus]